MADFFSTNLKYLREKNNLSQSKLAEKIGVNQTTIARWEDDNRIPTIYNAVDIANALDVPLPHLLGTDLRINNSNNTFNELELLFDKNKDILTEDDKEYIKFIIEKRKKEIDKELGKD